MTVGRDRFFGRVLRTQRREIFDLACSLWTGSLMIRRSALGPDRFDTGLETAEDRDLWIRLLGAHPTYIVPQLLATYVQVPGGISRTQVDRDCGCMLKVVDRYAALLGPAGVKEQEALVYRRWAATYLFQEQPAKALPHALHRSRLQPTSVEGWWIVFKSAASMVPGVGRLLRTARGPRG